MKNELFDMMLYISSSQKSHAEFCDRLKTMTVEDVCRCYELLKQNTPMHSPSPSALHR